MSLSKKQIVGVAVLLALVLLYVPIPFISGKSIASILLLAVAIYQLAIA